MVRLATVAFGLMGWASICMAQPGRYPQVIGPSGAAYGPTQAEYQYRQRYGHPSPEFMGGGIGTGYVNGYPGVNHGGYGHGHYHGPQAYFGFDLTPYAYPQQGYTYYPSTAYYGVAYPYGPLYPQPFLGPAAPAVIDPNVNSFNNGMMNPALMNNALGGNAGNPNAFAPLNRQDPVIQPSNIDARQRSLQYQVQGDELLRQLSFPAAAERYRKSADEARDRAEPRIRLGVTYAARSRFMEAAEQFQLSVALDPQWPRQYESLDSLIGEQNRFEKNRIMQRVAEWTLQDARDPNRLFLLGVILYLDGDARSREMFNTAQLLAGPQPHLTAFLEIPPMAAPQAQPQPNPAPVNNPNINGPNLGNAPVLPPAPANDLPRPLEIRQPEIPPLPQ